MINPIPRTQRAISPFEKSRTHLDPSIRHVVERLDNDAIRGMVNKVPHLVEIVEEES